MGQIFNDVLQTTLGSGNYTLQWLDAGIWTDITTITGPTTGDTNVNNSVNTIAVNNTIFIPGQSYKFRWIDGEGVISNTIQITIPELPGATTISGYSTVQSSIVFTNTGNDTWNVQFQFPPTSYQSAAGVPLSYNTSVTFWSEGHPQELYAWNGTEDNFSQPIEGHGAGVYEIRSTYIFSDGSIMMIKALYAVDGEAGNIIASVTANGTNMSAVTGLNMTETANVEFYNCAYVATWYCQVLLTIYELATGLTTPMTVLPNTVNIQMELAIDSLFTNDYAGVSYFILHSLTTE